MASALLGHLHRGLHNQVARDPKHHEKLRRDLLAWLAQAQRAGMHEEDILALVSRTLQDVHGRRVA